MPRAGHIDTPTSWRVSFECGVRGYHEYRTIWNPRLNEVLPATPEHHIPHDCFAVAVKKHLPGSLAVDSVVGHLPREISRFNCSWRKSIV